MLYRLYNHHSCFKCASGRRRWLRQQNDNVSGKSVGFCSGLSPRGDFHQVNNKFRIFRQLSFTTSYSYRIPL